MSARRVITTFALLPMLCWPVALPAAHPLITEDTGTQGAGHLQLEFTQEQLRLSRGSEKQWMALTTATVAWGFREDADLILSVPHLRAGASALDGTPSRHGLTDLGLDVKWRFYERGPLSMALKPGVTLPTGDDRQGLGVGKTTWSAYHVTTYGQPSWALHLHLGHVHHNNTSNERVDLWHASAAATVRPANTLQLVLDAGIDTHPDPDTDSSPVFVILGGIWSPRPSLDIDLGIKSERSDIHRAKTLLAGLTWRH